MFETPLQAAIEAAKDLRAERPGLQAMVAVVARKNKIISTGVNQQKTHRQAKTPYHTIHAEFNAIARASQDLRGADIYVMRVRADGHLSCSDPCSACESLIRRVGIKRIIFVSWTGNIMQRRPD